MKYQNASVLDSNTVEAGKTYQLGALPAGIAFTFNRKEYKTMTHPPFNLVARNCISQGQVWDVKQRKIQRIEYREEVRVLGKA